MLLPSHLTQFFLSGFFAIDTARICYQGHGEASIAGLIAYIHQDRKPGLHLDERALLAV
jgi:hypothetical protein